MLIWVLLAVFFWAVVPGLITGWMRRERGRSFFPGLFLGTVFGPFAILTTLAFIYFAERSAARRRRPKHGRAVRVFYDIPVVGRLHVSTVWALAGLATFLCLWMIGGIGYEFYRTSLLPEDSDGGPSATTVREKKTSDANSSAVAPSADSKLNSPAQSNNSAQTRAALLGNIWYVRARRHRPTQATRCHLSHSRRPARLRLRRPYPPRPPRPRKRPRSRARPPWPK